MNTKNIVEFLKNLEKEFFYGKIVLSFEKGSITVIKKEQTIKAKDLVKMVD